MLKALAAALLIVLVSALVAASVHFTGQALGTSDAEPKPTPTPTACPFSNGCDGPFSDG